MVLMVLFVFDDDLRNEQCKLRLIHIPAIAASHFLQGSLTQYLLHPSDKICILYERTVLYLIHELVLTPHVEHCLHDSIVVQA